MNIILQIALYVCAMIGCFVICIFLYGVILKPIVQYLKRCYIFYIKKNVRVPYYGNVYASLFLWPTEVDMMSRKEYKEKYGMDAKFKDCY